MKEAARLSFRSAAHTAGLASVKPKDYDKASMAEAPTAYAAWSQMNDSEEPLLVGDVLEAPDGSLRIYKYVGFEEASWVLPDIKTGMEGLPPAAGGVPNAQASA